MPSNFRAICRRARFAGQTGVSEKESDTLSVTGNVESRSPAATSDTDGTFSEKLGTSALNFEYPHLGPGSGWGTTLRQGGGEVDLPTVVGGCNFSELAPCRDAQQQESQIAAQ